MISGQPPSYQVKSVLATVKVEYSNLTIQAEGPFRETAGPSGHPPGPEAGQPADEPREDGAPRLRLRHRDQGQRAGRPWSGGIDS